MCELRYEAKLLGVYEGVKCASSRYSVNDKAAFSRVV